MALINEETDYDEPDVLSVCLAMLSIRNIDLPIYRLSLCDRNGKVISTSWRVLSGKYIWDNWEEECSVLLGGKDTPEDLSGMEIVIEKWREQ